MKAVRQLSVFKDVWTKLLVGDAVDGYEPITNRYEADNQVKFITFEMWKD